MLVDIVVTGRELAALTARGAVLTQVVQRAADGPARYRDSVRVAQQRARIGLSPKAAGTAAVDTLSFLQAYHFTTSGQTFVQVEVTTSAVADPDVEITITWRTADGTTGSFPLFRFEDVGHYMYHFSLPQPVPSAPVTLTATSSLGGTATQATQLWPDSTPPPLPSGYQRDFIDAYMTPLDIRERILRLERQYKGLVDVVDLPNATQGYRRTAVAYLGNPASAAVVVESVKFGDQGWNGVQVRSVAGAPGSALSAVYRDRLLTVTLATDAAGTVTSTTDQVAALVRARFPGRFSAFVESGSSGLPMPVAGPVALSDGLRAPASVPRHPWTVQALRIGFHRDGSRIGVLAYSQEHAREWATPLVTLEFAERLLANANTDPETRQLL